MHNTNNINNTLLTIYETLNKIDAQLSKLQDKLNTQDTQDTQGDDTNAKDDITLTPQQHQTINQYIVTQRKIIEKQYQQNLGNMARNVMQMIDDIEIQNKS